MRKGLLAAGAAITAMFWSALLPTAANSAVRSSAGSDARVSSVSCSSDGSCVAGGEYIDATFHGHAFVLTGKNGQWGKAIEVPGLAARKPKHAAIDSVSCAPAGGCVAGGAYLDASKRGHVFVTSEQNGRWGHLTTIFSGKMAGDSVTLSCPVTGSCTAGGAEPAFVASQTHGRWGKPIGLPSKAQTFAVVVSCASAGNCSAGWETLVASERNGRWGKPARVPGLAALGTDATVTSISCTSAFNCAVGGSYQLKGGASEVFVASKKGGHWGKAIEVPGFSALNTEGDGDLTSISCVSAGNCVAGGDYAATADFQGGAFEPFVASERSDRWGHAIEVPGIPPPSSAICEPDSNACVAGRVLSASCSRAGGCAAGGWYDTPAIDGQAAFVTSYKNGHWAKARQIPDLESLDTGKASQVLSVSCTSGSCAAGGSYSVGEPLVGPAFVTFEKNGTWGTAQTVRF
ncbi:MAG TPA: hypothetical protein VFI65_33860 [Streptosporangiaceae bacterium]|nr:hypothetical protein [Streptosporangiaceae bacterium]